MVAEFWTNFWAAIIGHAAEAAAAAVAAVAMLAWTALKSVRREYFATRAARKIGAAQCQTATGEGLCVLVAELESDPGNLLRDTILAELALTLKVQAGKSTEIKVHHVSSRLKWSRNSMSENKAGKVIARGEQLLNLARADVIIFGRATSKSAGFAAVLTRPELTPSTMDELKFVDWTDATRRDQAARWVVTILSDVIMRLATTKTVPVGHMPLSQIKAYSDRLYSVVSNAEAWPWFDSTEVKSLIGRLIELLAEHASRLESKEQYERLLTITEQAKDMSDLDLEEQLLIECYRCQARLGLFFTDIKRSREHRTERHRLGAHVRELAKKVGSQELRDFAKYWELKAKPGLRTYEAMLEIFHRSYDRTDYHFAAVALSQATEALLEMNDELAAFDIHHVEAMERVISSSAALPEMARKGQVDLKLVMNDPAFRSLLENPHTGSPSSQEELRSKYNSALGDLIGHLKLLLPKLSNSGDRLLVAVRLRQTEFIYPKIEDGNAAQYDTLRYDIQSAISDYPALAVEAMGAALTAFLHMNDSDGVRGELSELLITLKKFEESGIERPEIQWSRIVYMAAQAEEMLATKSHLRQEKVVRYLRAIKGYEKYKAMATSLPSDVTIGGDRIDIHISEALLRQSQYCEVPEQYDTIEKAMQLSASIAHRYESIFKSGQVIIDDVAHRGDYQQFPRTFALVTNQMSYGIKRMRAIEAGQGYSGPRNSNKWLSHFRSISEMALAQARGRNDGGAASDIQDAISSLE